MEPRRPGSPSRERASDPSGDPSLTRLRRIHNGVEENQRGPAAGKQAAGKQAARGGGVHRRRGSPGRGADGRRDGGAAAAPHAGTVAAQAPPSCTSGTTVQTKDGPVCGLTASSITSYLDIPYAAPPVGGLRWQPPQPHAPWTTVLPATAAAPECPSPGFPGSPPAAGTSEDCLYLKVEVPAGAKPGENLPVMYEIHGGGFLGTALTNDGDNLVHSGKVVYVFANYRLGILGFLADKALGSHSGDYGLQDQQAGLRWVQQNIASFGGNPATSPSSASPPAAPAPATRWPRRPRRAVREGDQRQRLLQLPGQHRVVEGGVQVDLLHRGSGPGGRRAVREQGRLRQRRDVAACLRASRKRRWSKTAVSSPSQPPAARSGPSSTAPP